MLTEDQIERRVEKMVDRLDRLFMAGSIDQATYTSNMNDLGRWAEGQRFANARTREARS